LEPAFDGALEQELHKALIAASRFAPEQIFASVDPLDLKLLPCFDAVPLPDLGGENDLTFAGNCGRHK
jgi:hypothetical protein